MLSETSGIGSTGQEVIFDLMVSLGQQLQLTVNAHGNKFEVRDEGTALMLTFSEAGNAYELLLSDDFVQLYPCGLSADVTRALTYIGEYIRCSDGGRLLLTASHAYETWEKDRLFAQPQPSGFPMLSHTNHPFTFHTAPGRA